MDNMINAEQSACGHWNPGRDQVKAICQQFGTPAFVYDLDFINANFHNLRDQLSRDVTIFYSLKANPNISITHHICKQGAGAEVSSQIELETALRAGVLPEDIIFVGPAKTRDELKSCIRAGIFAIVCEQIEEIIEIDAIVAETSAPGFQMPVMIRVNPEFSSAGSGLSMGGKPRQFGIDENQVRAASGQLKQLSSVLIKGFHVYMGTRYLNAQPVIENTNNIFKMVSELTSVLEIDLGAVDIGGGLGVPYFKNEPTLDIPVLCNGINPLIDAFRKNFPDTRIIMELGRYLVAGSGVMLSQVRHIKQSMGEKFIITNGGTNIHMAAVGIGSFVKRNFPVTNFSSSSTDTETVNITGPLCTPNDILAKRVELKSVEVGDIIGVLFSGAYGPTASPTQFLSHGYPAEILVIQQKPYLVRKRDDVDDLLGNQTLVT